MTKKNEVVESKEVFAVPALGGDIGELMAEEMEGMTMTFDRVKIPSGGGLAFEVPGDDPESPDMEKEIVGVIVDHHAVNAYWAEAYSGQNVQPDCASMDGKIGEVYATGEKKPCNNCPFNEWGSADDGRGKACKNMRRIYILREGELFPVLLTLPPTSLKNFSSYVAKRVVGRGKRTSAVITKVALKKATSSGGIAYSQATFTKMVDELPENNARAMHEYATQIKSITRNLEVNTDDYYEADNPGDDPSLDDVAF